MPEFLQNPASLTKEKLKSELVANNVKLPPGEQLKEVYINLYLKHLTSRNRNTTDFSSDEERESTPLRGRGRPPGRKATKKTDKPRAEEEKDFQDVTKLSNEALREELIKYGLNPGPILDSTRKVLEQRLVKLKEEGLSGTSAPQVADPLMAESNKQNGNNNSEQYSDNEEDPKTELTFEQREPLRGKPKTQILAHNKIIEQTEVDEDTEVNVKRSNRSPPKEFIPDAEEISSDSTTISKDAVTETQWTSEPSKTGRLLNFYKDVAKVPRRTPRKRVIAANPVTFDDNSEVPPITETLMPSNQTLAFNESEDFESHKLVNQVPSSLKHAEKLLSVSEFSELTRRTPKKQLISEKVVEKTVFEEKKTERDILKEMFPLEISTPTGISATCRRPIKGAAGRPFTPKDFKLEESYSSKYVPNTQPQWWK
ncbi:hypothetical protein GDO86_005634 [Hymenochirus boettgeri]|uniref:Thymopoietin n=1 Tax=Hymenochirus boettgeri TaxID=247094 RepID=A0A8T2J6W6_9PIPI|nr:hypothetical protein GDO86_005634 [Hymenochirus boettgeri]